MFLQPCANMNWSILLSANTTNPASSNIATSREMTPYTNALAFALFHANGVNMRLNVTTAPNRGSVWSLVAQTGGTWDRITDIITEDNQDEIKIIGSRYRLLKWGGLENTAAEQQWRKIASRIRKKCNQLSVSLWLGKNYFAVSFNFSCFNPVSSDRTVAWTLIS